MNAEENNKGVVMEPTTGETGEPEKEAEPQEWTNVKDMIRNYEMLRKDRQEDMNPKNKGPSKVRPVQDDGKTGGGDREGTAEEEEETVGKVSVPNVLRPKPRSVARLLRQQQVTSLSLSEDSSDGATEFDSGNRHDTYNPRSSHVIMAAERGPEEASSPVNSDTEGATATAASSSPKSRPVSKPIPMISKGHRRLTESKSFPAYRGDSSGAGSSPELKRSSRGKVDAEQRQDGVGKPDFVRITETETDFSASGSSSDELKMLLSPRTKFFVDTAKVIRGSMEEDRLDASDPAQLLRKKLLTSGRPRPRSLPPGDLQFLPKSASLDPNWAPRPLRRMLVLHESCAYQLPTDSTAPRTPCVPQTPLVPLPIPAAQDTNSSVESLEGANQLSAKSKVTRSVSTDSGLSLGAAVQQSKVTHHPSFPMSLASHTEVGAKSGKNNMKGKTGVHCVGNKIKHTERPWHFIAGCTDFSRCSAEGNECCAFFLVFVAKFMFLLLHESFLLCCVEHSHKSFATKKSPMLMLSCFFRCSLCLVLQWFSWAFPTTTTSTNEHNHFSVFGNREA